MTGVHHDGVADATRPSAWPGRDRDWLGAASASRAGVPGRWGRDEGRAGWQTEHGTLGTSASSARLPDAVRVGAGALPRPQAGPAAQAHTDRKSTRLNSSHLVISYAV